MATDCQREKTKMLLLCLYHCGDRVVETKKLLSASHTQETWYHYVMIFLPCILCILLVSFFPQHNFIFFRKKTKGEKLVPVIKTGTTQNAVEKNMDPSWFFILYIFLALIMTSGSVRLVFLMWSSWLFSCMVKHQIHSHHF